jgi:hypothetical protein
LVAVPFGGGRVGGWVVLGIVWLGFGTLVCPGVGTGTGTGACYIIILVKAP